MPCSNGARGVGGNLKTKARHYGVSPNCLEVLAASNGTCYLENDYIWVVDLKGGINEDVDAVVSFPCSKGYKDSVNGAFSPALDAFYFATEVGKMYREWYYYHPLTSPIPRAFVHFGKDLDNALWDGQNLILGDGGSETFPYSVIDAVSHELAHGVTERSSNLEFRKQSGAISESFSDMAGEAAEVYIKGSNDWVVGGDLLKKTGDAVR
ncbi:elastase [Aplysia californica]|uniref:Elastase n=1 Tax=Aplysia californica TaxID=6500 RepID=A0ABM1A6X7_APLCA|nr:elastase [Aplysia californica]